MTPEQAEEQKKLSKSVEEIRRALLGDEFGGRKGIIHYHDLMVEDIYGVGSDGRAIDAKKNTVLLRLSDIEDKHKKVTWALSGMIALVAIWKFGWSGITNLIDKLK